VIEATNLRVAIGASEILHGVDLTVSAGTLVALIGANGAGKSTLLRALSRLVPVKAGEIRFEGRRVVDLSAHRLAQMGLVHVPQGRQIIPSLTVEDNLLIGAVRMPHVSADERFILLEREYARFPVLRERRHLSGGSLSGGEQQMLAVSRALMMKPKLLMLDEPSLGLAPQVVAAIFAALRELRGCGMTILLVEQAAFMALKIADFAYVLQTGRIVLSGSGNDLLGHPALIQGYLG
jgi:branched-chain amino acid transport system ATP-binding protein